MRKVFFASTVEGAVASARRELGDDALLVDVQKAPGDRGAPDGYHVLFEVSCDGGKLEPSDAEVFARRINGDGTGDLVELKREMARLSALVACLASSETACHVRPELTRMAAGLQAYDLPPDWTRQILNRVERRLGREDRESVVARILTDELRSSVSFNSIDPASRKTVVALVGPPGAGKTTMLVKLAMRFGISAKRSTLVLTADTHRVSSADQLRTYAGILGLPFQLIESPRGLSSALAEHRHKELILIDTPGFSPSDWESAKEWSTMVDASANIQINLVLPATMRASDLRALVRRWAIFKPCQLIFTRMDETEAYGGCVAATLDSGMPISWFGTGQDIPEDLEPASADRLFSAVLGQDLKSMTAAA